jgi:hypothetical protein
MPPFNGPTSTDGEFGRDRSLSTLTVQPEVCVVVPVHRPTCAHLARCAVVEPAAGPVVVAVDVGGDHLPGLLIEHLQLVAPARSP